MTLMSRQRHIQQKIVENQCEIGKSTIYWRLMIFIWLMSCDCRTVVPLYMVSLWDAMFMLALKCHSSNVEPLSQSTHFALHSIRWCCDRKKRRPILIAHHHSLDIILQIIDDIKSFLFLHWPKAIETVIRN